MPDIIRVEIKKSELVDQIPQAYINYQLVKAGIPVDAHGHVTAGKVIVSEATDGYVFEWIPPNDYCAQGD